MDRIDPNIRGKQLRTESLERIEVGEIWKCGKLVACPHDGFGHPAVGSGEVCAIHRGIEARLEQPFDQQQHAHAENGNDKWRRTRSNLGPRLQETEKLHFRRWRLNETANAVTSDRFRTECFPALESV